MEQTQREPLLRVDGITCRFGKKTALEDLTVTLPAGRIVGLLGRNGAGKSTLLRIISGKLKPDAGEIAIAGLPLGVQAFEGLCLISDTPDFGGLRRMSDLFAVCAGLFPLWDPSYAVELAERFELPPKQRLRTYSRGMQTSVQLIVGLASGAALTFFDEPSLGLDAVMRERFYDMLLDEKRRRPERTFVLSTHLIDEVARALDEAVLIDAGRLLRQGTLAELTEGYLSVSGPADAVIDVTAGHVVLKEETLAGTLARHIQLADAEDGLRIKADPRVQTAPVPLQRLFVFLTEGKEAERHASNQQ